MITIVTMHDAVCDFLEAEVASKFQLKTADRHGKESFRKPQVIRSGWILPGENSQEEVFPFIIPRIDKAENIKGERTSVVTVEIYFGVYGPGTYDEEGNIVDDGSGYRDFWNLVETTRQALFSTLTIDNRYRLADDFFEASIISDQIYPYWEGYCLTKWYVLFPVPPLDRKSF